MIKTINISFTKEEHEKLFRDKNRIKKIKGLTKLSWRSYILHISGVKKL